MAKAADLGMKAAGLDDRFAATLSPTISFSTYHDAPRRMVFLSLLSHCLWQHWKGGE